MNKKIVFFNCLVIISSFIFNSCSESKEDYESTSALLSFNSFEKYGEIHNKFLSNFNREFTTNPEIRSVNEAIDYISFFHQNYVERLEMNSFEKNALVKSLGDSRRFLETDKFYQELFEPDYKSSGSRKGKYFEVNEKAFSKGLIDKFEFIGLNELGQKVKDNFDGVISDAELENFLIHLKDEWITQQYSVSSKHGQILAITLSIALASVEWWQQNPDAFDDSRKSTKTVAAVVAADVVGAGYSAVVAGIGSYTTKGEVNWGAVGIAACGGAIAGSTGIVGKAGKWIASFF